MDQSTGKTADRRAVSTTLGRAIKVHAVDVTYRELMVQHLDHLRRPDQLQLDVGAAGAVRAVLDVQGAQDRAIDSPVRGDVQRVEHRLPVNDAGAREVDVAAIVGSVTTGRRHHYPI